MPNTKPIPTEAVSYEVVPELRQTVPTAVSPHLDTIVIAVSDSKHADYALEWAMERMIRPSNKTVVLITVQSLTLAMAALPNEVLPTSYEFYKVPDDENLDHGPYSDEVEKLEFKDCCNMLRKNKAKLRKRFLEIEVNMIVAQGDAGEEIVDYTEAVKADALIVGSRGLSAMKRYLGLI
jgi:nucleotide-binding universal stress UspA family protein